MCSFFRGVVCLVFSAALLAQGNKGYYRFPVIHGNTIVFTAEGDLWSVSVEGGIARRLTSHPAEETDAWFSPDGKTLAFSGNYEGSAEVYTMPSAGGLPARRTFGGAVPAGWTPEGKILASTSMYAPLPRDAQLVTIDSTNHISRLPLHQAAQGAYEPDGKTLFFTRFRRQGSHAKRYQGGTAQKLWKFTSGREAVPLTEDYAGTSRDPMTWKGRVYFSSDRDGTMNLWSMDENGKNLRQHTRHQGWDVQTPSLHEGRVVYQLGADIHLHDIASGRDRKVDIEIASDFDHLRERWVQRPFEYTTSIQLSNDGSTIAMVSRGRVFAVPVKFGRLVEATGHKAARYRMARLLPDGKNLLVLSTEGGEAELWRIPANGVGDGEPLTSDGKILRWDAVPSPDGKWIAHTDKDNQLWLLNTDTKENKRLLIAKHGVSRGVNWSSDSRWFTFTQWASNDFQQIQLYSVESGQFTALTTDRYNSGNPAWSADGKYLYFVSDRALRSVTGAPWGPRQPDPFFDRSDKIYQMALTKGLRSPFAPPDELNPDKPAADAPKPDEKSKAEKPKVDIDLDGIQERIEEVPAPPGNFTGLTAAAKRLCWMSMDRADPEKNAVQCLDVQNKGDKPETLLEGVSMFQISADGKKMLIRKGGDVYVVDAAVRESAMKTPKTLADAKVNLSEWKFSVIPTEEYREAFVDAWRLHRDYFYDRNMHGVNWRALRDKYGELVSRVRDRAELSNLIAQLVSELSALHTSVRGGDLRGAPDQIALAALGARLEKDEAAGGWTVKHVYRSDPDRPDRRSPLARPGVEIREGDVILAINGIETLAPVHPYELLRNQTGKQVRLRIKLAGKSETRDVVVKPISANDELELRYHEWEYTRRLNVEQAGGGQIGYLHLRAMGRDDIAQFAEEYYPVFNRQGLIIDVRHNNGGNIDSWVLGKLMRKAWMYWKSRAEEPTWNMQYAFRGHMVVLVDEWTASDGEAFAEGFRRLGLGKIIGTRTWGGEIWLSASNVLADRGIATAAEMGVYGPEGKWLIEGHGVDPDIVVDNLPHATFSGKDAQLDAAVKHLQELIRKQPNLVPPPPPYPDKSFRPTAVSSGGGR